MRLYVEAALQDYLAGLAVPFVVRLQQTRRLVGLTRLKNLSRQNRNAEVGSWFAPEAWGRGANTESKLLLLEYAFERLHCIRVEFQTDSRNIRSRNALVRLELLRKESCDRGVLLARDPVGIQCSSASSTTSGRLSNAILRPGLRHNYCETGRAIAPHMVDLLE